jgi:hypothetical protein
VAQSAETRHYPDEVERNLRAAGIAPVPGTLLGATRGQGHRHRASAWGSDSSTRWTDFTLQVRVAPPGAAPFDVVFEQKIPPAVGIAIDGGRRDFSILIDPANPAQPRIDCAAFRKEARQAVEAAWAPPADPAERLRALGELHQSGGISDAEFAAQRAEILREL